MEISEQDLDALLENEYELAKCKTVFRILEKITDGNMPLDTLTGFLGHASKDALRALINNVDHVGISGIKTPRLIERKTDTDELIAHMQKVGIIKDELQLRLSLVETEDSNVH